MTGSPDRNGPRLPETAAIAERVAAMAERRGITAIADDLRQEVGRVAGTAAALVLAGETGQGKTSLVNALLDMPDLLPAGDRPAARVPVLVRWAPSASAAVVTEGETSPRVVDVDRLDDWVAPDAGDERVLRLEVGVPAEVLRSGLALVDTPGTGGLRSRYAEVAVSTMSRADALLLVSDADAPLLEAEIELIRHASARVATTLAVLSKIDAVPAWRDVWESDRRILDGIPEARIAAALPVSARLAALAAARAHSSPDLARRLRRESGIEALRTAIVREVVEPADDLRAGVLVRLADDALSRLAETDALVLAEPAESEHLAADLRAREAELRTLTRANAVWVAELNDLLQGLRLAMSDEVSRLTADLARAYERRIADGSEAPGHVLSALEADLALVSLRLRDALLNGVAEMLTDLSTSLGLEATWDLRDRLDPEGGHPALSAKRVAPPAQPIPPAVALLSPIALPISLTTSLAAFVGIGFAAAFPVGLAAGGVLAGVVAMSRRRSIQRQEARASLQATLNEAGTLLRNDMARRLVGVQRVVRDEVRGALERRTQDIQRALKAHQEAMQADRAARAAARREAESRLGETTAMRREIRALGVARE